MKKRYVVKLNQQERDELTVMVKTGKAAASKRRHAQVLILVDQGEWGPGFPDSTVAEQTLFSRRTVEQIRERCVNEGLTSALERKKRASSQSRIFDGEAEAKLVSLACQTPPTGYAKWTMQLLADKVVELEIVDCVSDETVRRVLKKRHQTVAEANVVHPCAG